MPTLTGNVDSDKQRLKLESERQKKIAATPLQQQIEEAIARGVGGSPKRVEQRHRSDGPFLQDMPVAGDKEAGFTRYPFDYKGDMKFSRMMKYEAYDWALLIKQREGHFIVTTLMKDEFVRADVVTDALGEPRYLLMSPEFNQPTKLLYTITLKGEMFTEKQKQAWKKEIRSGKIKSLELEVENLKKQHTQDLQKIGDLEKTNIELNRTLNLSLHDKLKKLLLHEKPEPEKNEEVAEE